MDAQILEGECSLQDRILLKIKFETFVDRPVLHSDTYIGIWW